MDEAAKRVSTLDECVRLLDGIREYIERGVAEEAALFEDGLPGGERELRVLECIVLLLSLRGIQVHGADIPRAVIREWMNLRGLVPLR